MSMPHFSHGQPPPAAPASSSAPPYAGGTAPGAAYYGESSGDAGPLHSLDPLRLLQIMRKKWLTLLLSMLFALGAAAFYLSRATALYQAQATI